MEDINRNWCIEKGFTHQIVNVASCDSYYYEQKHKCIIVFTRQSVGSYSLYVENFCTRKSVEITKKPCISHLKSLTIDDLKVACELVGIDYPFINDNL